MCPCYISLFPRSSWVRLLKNYFIQRDNKIETLLKREEEERLQEIEDTEQEQQKKLDEYIKGSN